MKNEKESVIIKTSLKEVEKEQRKMLNAFNDAYNKPHDKDPNEVFAKKLKISVEDATLLFYKELSKKDTTLKKFFYSTQSDLIALMEYVIQKENLSEEQVWNIIDEIKEKKIANQ